MNMMVYERGEATTLGHDASLLMLTFKFNHRERRVLELFMVLAQERSMEL